MIDRFRTYCKDIGIDLQKQKILLAVSGGADSMAMLHLFVQSGCKAGVAHCNFRLRETDSDLDEALVTQEVLKYKLQFHVTHFNTKEFAANNGISIEMAARELRYQWFENIRKTFDYDVIATAHHKDDNAETILLNQIRGTGIKGLIGISAFRNNIIRPMLFATRKDIEVYISNNNINFRTDRSNFDDIYKRNLIRNKVIPLLEQLNPSIIETLNQNAKNITESYIFYKKMINQYLGSLIIKKTNSENVSIEELQKTECIHLFLHEWLSVYGFSETTIKNIEENIGAQSGKKFYSSSHCLIKDRSELILSKIDSTLTDIEITDINSSVFEQYGFSIQILDKNNCNYKTQNTNIAFFDFEKLQFPLRLRSWQNGDICMPLGMKQNKKISDILIDSKISIPNKKQILVFENSDKDIIWIPGIKMCEKAKITAQTNIIIRIEKHV